MEPVIKVRHKSLLSTLSLTLILTLIGGSDAAHVVCDKHPTESNAEKTPGSNGFGVTIVGMPKLYRPSTQYTISLKVGNILLRKSNRSCSELLLLCSSLIERLNCHSKSDQL